MRRWLPLRDPIQEVIDRQMRSLSTTWDQPPPQKNCHTMSGVESEIVDALDEKASFGFYQGRVVSMFSLTRR